MIAEPGRYFACSTHVLAMSVISKRCTTTDCDKVCIYMHVDTVTHVDMGAYTVCAQSPFNGFSRPKAYYYCTDKERFV